MNEYPKSFSHSFHHTFAALWTQCLYNLFDSKHVHFVVGISVAYQDMVESHFLTLLKLGVSMNLF
jgi:hypothetical protein